MITLKWENNPEDQIQALMERYADLPRHIAKKHLQAAMRRTLKDGVPVLRSFTPPVGARRGRRKKGERGTTGKLRRSVTTKAKYVGKNADGYVWGVVGYKYGIESKKALWLDEGTKYIAPRRIMEQFRSAYNGPAIKVLCQEMAAAFEKAVKEKESGQNPGRAN